MRLPTKKAPKAWTENATREPAIRPNATARDGDVFKATGDHAVPAFATVRLSRNGVATDLTAKADDKGRFSIDIPPGWDSDDIALTVDHRVKPARIVIQDARSSTGGADFMEEAKKVLLDQVQDLSGGVAFEIDGFHPGFTLNVTVGDDSHTFTADDSGKLAVSLDAADPGASVRITSKKVRAWEPGAWSTPREQGDVFSPKFQPDPARPHTGRYVDRQLDIKAKVPDSPLAARRKEVAAALHDTTADNVAFAMTLFGPNDQFPALADITDPARIRSIFLGAQLGFVGNQKGPWFDAVRKHVVGLAKKKGLSDTQLKDLTDGMDIWKHYQGKARPGPDDSVRLFLAEQGRESITITGGYSPISGSHGPLTPERTRTPDRYQLVLDNLDFLLPDNKASRLTLTKGGRAPQGWVNTNAISFTVGHQTAG